MSNELGNLGMGISATNQLRAMSEIEDAIEEFKSALTEVEVLERSNQLYRVKKIDGLNSRNYNGVITSEFDTEVDLAHELKHMYQFDNKQLSFPLEGKKRGFLYDVYDELEAIYRESFYSGDKSRRYMTSFELRKISTYQALRDIPLNSKSIMKEVFKNDKEFLFYIDKKDKMMPFDEGVKKYKIDEYLKE